jgi:hypothetical protein
MFLMNFEAEQPWLCTGCFTVQNNSHYMMWLVAQCVSHQHTARWL